MDTFTPVPNYQPLPFPLPVWLMQTLLVLGFFLHALPMNVLLGGGFICAALFLTSKSKDSYQFRAAKALAVSLPVFISFAVTQGIVPLLFLQLVYGPAFYTSSILMAVPWISLLLVVMISYYLSYITIYRVLKKNDDKTATKAALVLLVMAIGFSLVGWLFSNNMTLMLSPQKWLTMYQANANGLHLNTSEPTLHARYAHMFVSAFAVTGMTLGCFGLFVKHDTAYSQWLIKTGSKIFVVATILQIPVGLWFLKTLPPQFAANFLGADKIAAAVFAGSMVLMVVALLATCVSATSGNRLAFVGGLIANALLILAMIVNRHQLRLFHLQTYVNPDMVKVSTQWDLLAIFLVSTVGLIFYLVWLGKLAFRALMPRTESVAQPISGAVQ